MQNEQLRAKEILHNKQCTCVVLVQETCLTSNKSGIRPVLDWLRADNTALRGGTAADKVVGKAAAMLFVYGGVTAVWAEIISEPAYAFLQQHGVAVTYGKLVAAIHNREGTGLCPMEQHALRMEAAGEAYRFFDALLPR